MLFVRLSLLWVSVLVVLVLECRRSAVLEFVGVFLS